MQFQQGTKGLRTGDTLNRQRATDDMEKAKVVMLALFRQGMSVKDAAAEVGRSPKTFYSWMRLSTKYRQQVEIAQAQWIRTEAQQAQPYRAQMDEFEPILRKDFATWTEYQVAFRKAYFGHDTFDHLWRVLEAWEAAPPGGISMILLPPEGGKTTLLKDVIIGDLCDNANIRCAMISEAQDFARKSMAHLQRRLTLEPGSPSPLFEHFGPFAGLAGQSRTKKWNADEFTLMASDHDEQDPSVVSVGINGNIRGARWDRVYLDDVQSLRTQNNTKKMIETFRGDIITRPGRLGRIIITGSRVCRGDFYEELERLDILDELVVIPAMDMSKPLGQRSYFPRQLDPEGLPLQGEDGKQLGWSDEDLAQRWEKVGDDQWSRVYMMKPQSDFSAMLTAEDIVKATDQDRHVGQPVGVSSIAGLDPSLAGHAAYTYCGYDADHLYVMDLKDFFKPTTNQNLFAGIREGTVKYRPEYWVIENNTLQKGYLTDDAFIALRDEMKFHAVGHHTGENKTDQQLGIPAMMNAIVRGEIRFPKIGPNDTAFATLFDQLMAWREDIPTKRLVQDQVMSLWFCYLLWRKLRMALTQDAGAWKRPGLDQITRYPYAKTHIALPESNEAPRTPMTYGQHWESLAREAV